MKASMVNGEVVLTMDVEEAEMLSLVSEVMMQEILVQQESGVKFSESEIRRMDSEYEFNARIFDTLDSVLP